MLEKIAGRHDKYTQALVQLGWKKMLFKYLYRETGMPFLEGKEEQRTVSRTKVELGLLIPWKPVKIHRKFDYI